MVAIWAVTTHRLCGMLAPGFEPGTAMQHHHLWIRFRNGRFGKVPYGDLANAIDSLTYFQKELEAGRGCIERTWVTTGDPSLPIFGKPPRDWTPDSPALTNP